MAMPPDTTKRPRPLIEINVRRAAIATVLLAGLFAALWFWLLPRDGGDASIPPARLVDGPPAPAGSYGVHPGDLARDFEISGLDGQRFSLSELRGVPVVINFWASWCTSCLAELPALEEQRLAREADGLVVLAVNVGEGPGDARKFVERLGVEGLAIAMDPDLSVADGFGVRGLPHSLFIDSGGEIRAEYVGQLDDDTLESYVVAAIEAVPGAPPPDRIRIVTTVAREHVLDATVDEDKSTIRFVSRRFRCTDDYCFDQALTVIGEATGVVGVEVVWGVLEPELIVSFNPDVTEAQDVIDAVAVVVAGVEDPLYTRELEVRVN